MEICHQILDSKSENLEAKYFQWSKDDDTVKVHRDVVDVFIAYQDIVVKIKKTSRQINLICFPE